MRCAGWFASASPHPRVKKSVLQPFDQGAGSPCDIFPCLVKAFIFAEIRVGDAAAFAAGDEVHEEAEVGGAIGGADAAEVFEVFRVEGEDMVEAVEVMGRDLAAAISGDVDAVAQRHGLRAAVGWGADMPVAGSCGIDLEGQASALGFGAEGGFCEGRAADIAEADQEDGDAHPSAAAVDSPSCGTPIERRPPKSVRATMTPIFSI